MKNKKKDNFQSILKLAQSDNKKFKEQKQAKKDAMTSEELKKYDSLMNVYMRSAPIAFDDVSISYSKKDEKNIKAYKEHQTKMNDLLESQKAQEEVKKLETQEGIAKQIGLIATAMTLGPLNALFLNKLNNTIGIKGTAGMIANVALEGAKLVSTAATGNFRADLMMHDDSFEDWKDSIYGMAKIAHKKVQADYGDKNQKNKRYQELNQIKEDIEQKELYKAKHREYEDYSEDASWKEKMDVIGLNYARGKHTKAALQFIDTLTFEWWDEHVSTPIMKTMGVKQKAGAPSTLNMFLDKQTERINRATVIDSDFAWDNPETSIFSESFIDYSLNTLKDGIPQIVAQRIMMGAGLKISPKIKGVIKKAAGTNKMMAAIIKTKKSIAKSGTITKAGIVLTGTLNESNQIGRQAYKDAKLFLQTKYGGEDLKNAWENHVKNLIRSNSSLSEEKLHNLIEEHKESFFENYFKDSEYEEVIEKNAIKSYNIGRSSNMLALATNAFELGMMMKYLKPGTVKALGKTRYSRFVPDKASKLKDLRTIGADAFVEGFIEEGGINKYAEWKAEAFYKGEAFNLAHYTKKFLAGETIEDTFAGILISAPVTAGSTIWSYKDRKKAYEVYAKAIENMEKELTVKDINALKRVGALNRNSEVINEIKVELKAAIKEAKDNNRNPDTDPKVTGLRQQFLVNQALQAFKNGTTEKLVGFYSDIAMNNADPAMKEEASNKVKEILELEKAYNATRELHDSDKIFSLVAANIGANGSIEEAVKFLNEKRTELETELSSLNGKYDATYNIEKNGKITFKGRQAKEFQDAVEKSEILKEFNNINESVAQMQNLSAQYQTEIDRLSSKKHQTDMQEINVINKHIQRNEVDFYGSETKEIFAKKIKKLIDNSSISKELGKELLKQHIIQFDNLTDAHEKKMNEKAEIYKQNDDKIKSKRRKAAFETKEMEAAATNLKKSKKKNKIPRKLKKQLKKQNNVDHSIDHSIDPNEDRPNLTSKQKTDIKAATKGIIDSDPSIDTFVDYMHAIIKMLGRERAERNYDLHVMGWKANGRILHRTNDYNTIFGPAKLSKEESVNVFDELDKTTENLKEETVEETVPVPKEVPQDIVEDDTTDPVVSPEKQKQRDTTKSTIKAKVLVITRLIKQTVNDADQIVTRFFDNKAFPNARRIMNNNGLTVGNTITFNTTPITSIYHKIFIRGANLFKVSSDADFQTQNYQRTRSTLTTEITEVTEKDGVYTFTETINDKKVSGKNYNLDRTTKRKDGTIFSDEFFIMDDAVDHMLRDPNIDGVTLHKVVNKNKNGKSTVDITIKYKDGTTVSKINIEIANDHEMHAPIIVGDTDKVGVGFLNTVPKMSIDGGNDTNRTEKKKLIEYRKKIFNGEITTAIIDSKIADQYFTLENPQSIMSQDPNSLIGISYRGDIRINGVPFFNKSRRLLKDSNGSDGVSGNNGTVHELRQMGTTIENGKVIKLYRAFTVNTKQKMSNNGVINLTIGMRAYFSGKFGLGDMLPGKKVSTYKNKMEISDDNSLVKGLMPFIGKFVGARVGKEFDTKNKQGYDVLNEELIKKQLETSNEAGARLIIYGNVIYFFKLGPKIPGTTNRAYEVIKVFTSINKPMNDMAKKNIEKMLVSIEKNGKYLQRFHNDTTPKNKKNIFEFDNKKNIIEGSDKSYDTFEKEEIQTLIQGNKFTDSKGDVFHATGINPTIVLDTDIKGDLVSLPPESLPDGKIRPVQEPISKELEDAENENRPVVRKDLLNDIRKALLELGSKNIDSLLNNVAVDNAIGLSDSEIDAILSKMETIDGINPSELNLMGLAIMNSIINKYDDIPTIEQITDSLKTAYDDLIAPRKQQYLDLIEELKKLNDSEYDNIIKELESKIKVFDTIKNRWSKVEIFTKDLFEKYLKVKEDTDEKATTSREKAEKIYNKEAVEHEGAESISAELKRFFAGIELKTEEGKVERGYLGLPMYVHFDSSTNIIKQIIGSYPKADMSFDDVLQRLESHKKTYPFLEDVITKIKDADTSIQAKFMKFVSKHNISMKFAMYEYDSKTGVYEVQIYNTNSGDIGRILTREWEQAFTISEIVDSFGNVNISKVDELLDQFDTLHKDFLENKNKMNTQAMLDWLNEFGISLDPKTLKSYMEDEIYNSRGMPIKFKGSFNKSGTSNDLFGGLAFAIEQLKKDNSNIIDNPTTNPLKNISNVLMSVAKVEGLYDTRAVTSAFRTGGKTVNGYVSSKFATDRVEDLKEDGEVRKQLLQDPFSTNSMLLEMLNDDNGAELETLLYIDHIDLVARKDRNEAKDVEDALSKMPEAEQELTQRDYFQDVRQQRLEMKYKDHFKLRMATMFFPTMSDKKQMFGMYMPVLDLSNNTNKDLWIENKKIQYSNELAEVLQEQLFVPELNRILSYWKNKAEGKIENIEGYNNAARMFLQIPAFNSIKIKGLSILEFLKINHNMDVTGIQNLIGDQASKIIKNTVQNDVNKKLRNDRMDIVNKEYKEKVAEVSQEDISQYAAADFVINNFLSLANIFQTVAGDVAFYATDKHFNNQFKTIDGELDISKPVNSNSYVATVMNINDNLGKRLALLHAPGDKLMDMKNPDGTIAKQYIQLFLKDTYAVATNIEELIRIHYGEKEAKAFADGKRTRDDFPIIDDFFSVNETDAQEYTTMKEHLDILLYADGKITQDQYDKYLANYNSQKDGLTDENKFSTEELKIIFQPIKPVHTGSTFENGKMRVHYVKSSSYPLLPQVIGNSELNQLRIAMEEIEHKEKKNVRAAYKTATKVGATVTELDPFTGKLNIGEIMQSSALLDRKNFRIQQDVPVHALETKKDEILMGTQLSKLLFGDGVLDVENINYMGTPIKPKDLLDKYNNAFKNLIDIAKSELFDELGLNSYGEIINEKDFLTKLSKLLIREAKDKNYPKQDIEGLQITTNPDGTFNFRNSIWLSTNSLRFEALLNSLITKRIVKLTLPGYSYVAGSRRGYKLVNEKDAKTVESRMIYTKHFDGENLKAAGAIDRTKTNDVQEGENINSEGSILAKKLTNPGNTVSVEYKGKTFRNAEHAYQTWKSGKFDEVAYNNGFYSDQAKANIPQNLVSGRAAYGTFQEADESIKAILGDNPHSIDMIFNKLRTRTTRSASELQKYNIKVGDVIKHFGKSTDGTNKTVYAVITAIHSDTSSEFKSTWYKEGWTQSGIKFLDRLKSGAAAIEFEVINPGNQFKPRGSKAVSKETSQQTMTEIITAKLEQHPELVQEITDKGGIEWLNKSTHEGFNDKFWEGKDGGFMTALKVAYLKATKNESENITVIKLQKNPVNIEARFPKDQLKANYADGIIGYGTHSTGKYAKNFGGTRTSFKSGETIMISVNGRNRPNQTENVQKTKKAIDDAIKAGVSHFVADIEKNANSNHNKTGEGVIREYLLSKGLVYSEQNGVGVYSKVAKNELLTDTEEEATQAYNDWLTTDKYANNTELEKKKKAAQKVKKEVKKITDIEKPTLSIEFKNDEFFISEDDSLIKALEQTEIETDYDDLNQLIKCIWG